MSKRIIYAFLSVVFLALLWLLTSTYLDVRKYKPDPSKASVGFICQFNHFSLVALVSLTRDNDFEYLLGERRIWCSNERAIGVSTHRSLAQLDYGLSMVRLSEKLAGTPYLMVSDNEGQMWFDKAIAKNEPRALQKLKDEALTEEAKNINGFHKN